MRSGRHTVLALALAAAAAIALAGCSTGGGSAGGAAAAPASAATGAPPPAPTLRAGAARVDCTPPVGTPLGGYGGGPRRILDQWTIPINIAAALGQNVKTNPAAYATLFEPSTGALDGVAAKAIVLERSGERYAILSLDAIGVSKRARDEIVRRIAPHGFLPERTLVSATHTHSGPGAIADKRLWQLCAMDLLDGRVFDRYMDRAAQAVIDAAARLEPARIGIAVEAETGVSRNRRGLPIVDPDLSTVYVERPDGTPIALAVNLAIHGICLDADNLRFSADLMGFCEREVEAQLGYGAVCLYLNGAEGDVSPNQYGWAGAEAVGKAIAGHALALVPRAAAAARDDVELAASLTTYRFPSTPRIDLGKVQGPLAAYTQVNLSFLRLAFGTAILEMDDLWFNRDIPLQAMRLGDACLLAFPGEALTQVGLDLKAAARGLGFAHPIVVGLANDHVGYVADPVEYDKGGYEALMTFFGRDSAAVLTSELIREADRIKP